MRYPFTLWLAVLLWFQDLPTQAQAARPQAYDFLTMTSFESSSDAVAKIFFSPAFNGKTEVQLEDLGGMSVSKNLAKLQRNSMVINQQLSDLSVAGWELVQVYPITNSAAIRYLFRKPR
ncbi:hypothetical protein [Hymenobacter saemangeumensis]